MTKLFVALVLLTACLLAAYRWPVPKKDFAELAERVPPEDRQSLLDFRSRFPLKHVRAGGHDWEYVTLGQGDRTILFLHGMTGAYDIWWQQMVALADHYRVVSLTYPPVPNLEALSHGVLAVLDAERVTRANMVGTSLGGYLLQYLMVRHPDRIERAVLGNTFPPNDLLRRQNARLIRLLPWLPDWLVMTIFRRSFAERVYPAAGHSELVQAYLMEQVSGRMSKAQVTARARAVIEPFAPRDPRALGIPVMIIEADNDPLVAAPLRHALKAAYPGAAVHTLHAVGHFPYLNAPETYTALLRAFFGEES